ncbi:MAG: cysteine hydrolase [Armatimonadetes bacterium]|nr:cysteine hydrolase [Armatimonadota bacterium]
MRLRVPFRNLANATPAFPIAEGRTVLLVLDVHRFTVSREEGYARLARERGISRELDEYHEQVDLMLPNLRRLLDGCRRRGAGVIFTRLVLPEDGGVSTQAEVTGLYAARDSLEAEFLPEVAPRSGEAVFDKTTVSAFNGTDLDRTLRHLGTRYLLLAGVPANGAVEHTARDAADLGYGVVIVSDACAGDTWAHHALVMANAGSGLVRVRTTEMVLEMLDRKRT